MSAAISAKSPAGAAPSRCFRGTGSGATAASFGWLPSSIPRPRIGSRRGRSSDASQTFERGQAVRGAQPSRLLLVAAVRARCRRAEAIHRRAFAFSARRRRWPRCLADREGLLRARGRATLIAGGRETVLKANDSCFIGPNESREIVNRGNDVVTMLVAVSTPQQ